jgi:probable HAF family extracellular repeat protein
MRTRNRLLLAGVLVGLAFALGNFGCGGGQAFTVSLPITVTISPASATVDSTGTQQFTAAISNDPTNKGVTWSISPASGAGTLSKMTNTSATYTAPTSPASTLNVTITATAVADTTKSAFATIAVAPIAVTVNPSAATVQTGSTKPFTATVSNDPTNGGVTWTVSCSTAQCGTVSPTATASGAATTYTAPSTTPLSGLTVTLTATSVTLASASASANITFTGVTASVSPGSASLEVGASKQFTATVTNDPTNSGVTWGVSCPTTLCGTVSPTTTASGSPATYTAPATPPLSNLIVVITATSVALNSASASATVTVLAIGVAISPISALLPGGTTQAFTAAVSNDPTNGGVTWALTENGTACAATACGTLSSTSANPVNYSSPASVAATTGVTLTATSVKDTTKSATATIDLTFGTVELVPDRLDFGFVLYGGSQKAITLTNTANTVLTIAGITATGTLNYDGSQAFSQTNDCGTTVVPRGSCTITVIFGPRFKPGQLLTYNGNLTIRDSSTDSPQQVSLSGRSGFPHLVAQPASLSSAQANPAAPQYIVVKLGSLGGTVGRSNAVNDRGWVSGWSSLSGDTNHHAVLWIGGQTSDLGTLGGRNSEIEFTATNNFGLLAGGSDTSNVDPYAENFCFFTASSNVTCSAFQWQNGVMSALSGLGGNNSYATDSNRSGHIVGWVETPILDSNCLAPQVFDWHGGLWRDGQIQDLPPLPGDALSVAMAINDLDVAAGGSGICGSAGVQGTALSTHAVIWRDGSPTDLGSLGGQMNNLATGINNLGQVVGLSDVLGDTTAHAFLWQDGAMTDLGTLPGDVFSVAWGISGGGQVLGQSCDANGNCRGFLWQDGVMTDVNSLIPAGSPLVVIDANEINSAGEITGQAFDPLTGEMPAIEMIPCTQTDDPSCKSSARENVRVALPQYVRDALRQKRLHFKK